jgi:hypothetical protein
MTVPADEIDTGQPAEGDDQDALADEWEAMVAGGDDDALPVDDMAAGGQSTRPQSG